MVTCITGFNRSGYEASYLPIHTTYIPEDMAAYKQHFSKSGNTEYLDALSRMLTTKTAERLLFQRSYTARPTTTTTTSRRHKLHV
jgi:hypothetical protein